MVVRKLKTSEKRLIGLAVVTALILTVYAYLVEPRIEQIIRIHKELVRVENDLTEFKRLISHREEITAQAERLSKHIGTVGNEEEEIKAFLEEIEKLTRGSNLRTVSLRPQRTRETGHYRMLGLDLVAEGGEGEIGRFLHSIGDSTQLLRVELMQLNSMRQPGQVQANFNIVRIISPRSRS